MRVVVETLAILIRRQRIVVSALYFRRHVISSYTYCYVMKTNKFVKEAAQLAAPYRIAQGEKFHLKDHDPEDTGGMKDKHEAHGLLQHSVEMLRHLQEKLYAQD